MDKRKSNLMSSKRKSKSRAMLVDSDDNEPIGAFLKLKAKRGSKKAKVVPDDGESRAKLAGKVAVNAEELDMDDTLANFKKKLKGPKKYSGSVAGEVKYSISNLTEPLCESLTEPIQAMELVPDSISPLQEKSPSSTKGECSENAALVNSSNMQGNKISEGSADTKLVRMKSKFVGDFDSQVSRIDKLQHEKVRSLEPPDEVLGDLLSPSGLRASSDKITGFQNGEVSSESPGQHSAPAFDAPPGKTLDVCEVDFVAMKDQPPTPLEESHVIPNCDEKDRVDTLDAQVILTPLSVNKKICSPILEEDTKFGSESNLLKKIPEATFLSRHTDNKLQQLAANTELQSVGGYGKLESGPHSSVGTLGKYSGERDHASISSQGDLKVSEHRSSPENQKNEVASRMNHANVSIDGSERVLESCHGAFPPTYDYPYGDEEVDITLHGVTTIDERSSPDDREESPDAPGTKEGSQSVRQRAARNAKKRKHGDMAYEGDAAWEVLVHGQEFFASHQADKTREKFNSSSLLAFDAQNGKAAAVAAGLKARAVSPIEKIKFKEVLKRKGGLQEYLECRNHILSLWNKDVTSILQLSDLGISDARCGYESPRSSLIKDVYVFLDQCGYINFGVPSDKEKVDNYIKHESKPLTEKPTLDSGLPVTDSELGVSSSHGNNEISETCTGTKNHDLLADEKKAGMFETEVKVDDYNKHDSESPRVKPELNSGLPVTALELGVSFSHGNNESSENCTVMKNADVLADGKKVAMVETEVKIDNVQALESSVTSVHEGCFPDIIAAVNSLDPLPLKTEADSNYLASGPSYKDENADGEVFSVPSRIPTTCADSIDMDCTYSQIKSGSQSRKSIIVVGAGPAGLTAARHLQQQGFCVTVLEARSRIGGRVFTDHSSLSVPVDLGASIITGVEADMDTERRPDPSSLVCAQLGLELTVLNSDCPLYDTVTAEKVPTELDEALESEYNSLLDEMELLVAEKGEYSLKMSLEEGLEYALKRRRLSSSGPDETGNLPMKSPHTLAIRSNPSGQDAKTESLSPLERRVMDWHFAHLEYGCAASLKDVSLPNWNQDDVYGGFGGAHCMIKGGYSAVVDSLGKGISIKLDHVVTEIAYTPNGCAPNDDMHRKVRVLTSNGEEFSGDAVLVTIPLGCLKEESIKFSPPLPQWKYASIKRLGFGVLNKVVLEFSEVFWDDTVDYFGATAEYTDQRGRCFMFWNVKKTVGAPVLIALVVGKAAKDGQEISSSDQVSHALLVLRKLFGEERVSDPVASVVTDWGRDPYSYGAYSYVAVGSSGEDYDILGKPVENCVFFAGEATCKEHPDTVGGAMLSGLREAVRIIDLLNSGVDYTAEVEAMEAARRHLDIEKSEVKDLIRRFEAVKFSSFAYNNSLDRLKISKWGSMLKDMFFNAKTTSGRLHLAKELLNLPVGFLKSFASTREGLKTLNSWILDSMGKDGTQLLRHCVRLLVLVSNDLHAVRLSGIGKTVKEKVCVHTSRDIRAIASQLVSVWVHLFRKEKAANGKPKSQRLSSGFDSKSNSTAVFRMPPVRTHHASLESKEPSKEKASAGHRLPSGASGKKLMGKPVKGEAKVEEEEASEIPMSEEEKAAIEAAEKAQAAAVAAAKAYASSARNSMAPQLPKILSFQKFATRDQFSHMDEPDSRKKWSGAALGTQDCLSEIDSRNCRVRDWPVDFSAAGVNMDNSKLSAENHSQRSHSNEAASQLNFREHSGESVAVDSSILTKAWVDSVGSTGLKDYSAIERWQCQAAAANSGFHGMDDIRDEEDSNTNLKPHKWKHDMPPNDSSTSQVTMKKESRGSQQRGAERIKQSVVDYTNSLLMPLFKAKKLDRVSFKSIMKKTAAKVMENTTDAEKRMVVSDFLDPKRKNKIRAYVDTLVDRHMETKSDDK